MSADWCARYWGKRLARALPRMMISQVARRRRYWTAISVFSYDIHSQSYEVAIPSRRNMNLNNRRQTFYRNAYDDGYDDTRDRLQLMLVWCIALSIEGSKHSRERKV